jgi:membrane fusion protein
MELFRPEVSERSKVLARPVLELSQPAGSWWATAAIALLFVIALAAASLIRSPRSVTLRGVLVSSNRPLEITAPRTGTVSGLYVADGALVRAGARLVKVDVEQPTDALASPAAGSIDALQRMRTAALREAPILESGHSEEVRGLVGLHRNMLDQLSSVERQIETSARMAALSERSLTAVQPLIDRGFISRAEVDRRQQSVLAQQVQLDSLRQRRAELLGQVSELAGRIGQARISTAGRSQALQGQLADLDSRIAQAAANRPYFIEASINGRVTSIRASLGQPVQAGALLFVIVPARPVFEIEVYASSSDVAEISPRQPVEIEYDAFPAGTYGTERGIVVSVSRAPIRLAGQERGDAPVFVVRVRIVAGSNRQIASAAPRTNGMTVRAKILGRSQSLLAAISLAVIGS